MSMLYIIISQWCCRSVMLTHTHTHTLFKSVEGPMQVEFFHVLHEFTYSVQSAQPEVEYLGSNLFALSNISVLSEIKNFITMYRTHSWFNVSSPFLPFPHFFYENICSYIAHISVLSMKDWLWNSSPSLRILYSIGQKMRAIFWFQVLSYVNC